VHDRRIYYLEDLAGDKVYEFCYVTAKQSEVSVGVSPCDHWIADCCAERSRNGATRIQLLTSFCICKTGRNPRNLLVLLQLRESFSNCVTTGSWTGDSRPDTPENCQRVWPSYTASDPRKGARHTDVIGSEAGQMYLPTRNAFCTELIAHDFGNRFRSN